MKIDVSLLRSVKFPIYEPNDKVKRKMPYFLDHY